MRLTKYFLYIAFLAGISLMAVDGFAFDGNQDKARIRTAEYGDSGYEIKLVGRDGHRRGDYHRKDRYYGRHDRYDRDRNRHYRHRGNYGQNRGHYYKPRYYPYYRPYNYYYGSPYGYYHHGPSYGPSYGFGFHFSY